MGKKRRILFTVEPGQALHKVFRTFILQPPEGYEYIDVRGRKPSPSNANLSSSPLLWLFNLKRKFPWLIFHYKEREEWRYSRLIDEQRPDLVYCINGRLYRGKRPWVVDFENPSVFLSYNMEALRRYREQIKRILLRKNCKAVIAYSQVGKRSLVEFFGKELEEKTIVIENAFTPPRDAKKIPRAGFNLLFTGSSNIDDNFYGRGGREVVRAFLSLSEKHKDIKLVMRCRLPEKERKLLEGKNVEIHEDLLTAQEFEKMWRSADAYMFTSFYAYALTGLEALGYGLPLIMTDLLDNSELIQDGIEGIKVRPPRIEWVAPHLPAYYFDKGYEYPYDERYIARIVAAVERLYLDRDLLHRMSKAARVRSKKYTIEEKNRKLDVLFKRALQ